MHSGACQLALGAVCAQEQGGFWAFHDALFGAASCPKQGPMPALRTWFKQQRAAGHRPPVLNQATFLKVAKRLRLNLARFKRDQQDPKRLAQIRADMALAKKLGARGTPATFINGRFVRGAKSFAALKKEIVLEVTRAKRLLKLGRITRFRLYDLFLAFGKE